MEFLSRFDLDLVELNSWVESVAGTPTPPVMLNDKGWSIVLHFGVAVLKVTEPNAFPNGPKMFELVGRAGPGLVPELLAWRVSDTGQHEMLFRPFEGRSVVSLPAVDQPDALVAIARTVATVQSAAKLIERSGLPIVRASDVPSMLEQILDVAVPRCRLDYPDRWAVECAKQEVSVDFAAEVSGLSGAVTEWTAELESGGWSDSVDHVDLLPHNANILPSGACLVYDWEQATVGVPFFSIDILLAYAQCVDEGLSGLDLCPERATATQHRIKEAYLTELPGPLELALRLSPIRYCWSEWRLADAAEVVHYAVDDVVWWLSRGLRRWGV